MVEAEQVGEGGGVEWVVDRLAVVGDEFGTVNKAYEGYQVCSQKVRHVVEVAQTLDSIVHMFAVVVGVGKWHVDGQS